MGAFSDSYVLRVLLATPAPARSLHAAVRRWADPYRPELYYMRGPGPKWREKHAHCAGSLQCLQQGSAGGLSSENLDSHTSQCAN
jgi:hypothetical protein